MRDDDGGRHHPAVHEPAAVEGAQPAAADPGPGAEAFGVQGAGRPGPGGRPAGFHFGTRIPQTQGMKNPDRSENPRGPSADQIVADASPSEREALFSGTATRAYRL